MVVFIVDLSCAGGRHAPDRVPGEGDIVDESGAVVGKHAGVHHYTVGQRKGLGAGRKHPLYVIGVDAAANRVIAGEEASLERGSLTAARVNWLAEPRFGERVSVKIRHKNEPTFARLAPAADRSVKVVFDEPKKAIAPGQAAVFYDGDHVLGGGWIL